MAVDCVRGQAAAVVVHSKAPRNPSYVVSKGYFGGTKWGGFCHSVPAPPFLRRVLVGPSW